MEEEQAQIGAPLHQLTRYIALGTAGQLHLQKRVAAGQFVEAVDHRLIRHGFVLGNPQQGFLATHQRERPAIQAFALTQQFTGIFQQGRTVFGQPGLAAAAALEQGDAKVGFQQRDGIAYGRLRLTLLARNGGERTQLGNPCKQAQLFQIPALCH